MILEKWSTHERVISTFVVLVILTLSVSIFPTSAAHRDNDAIRIYEALTSVDTATTEYVYMTGTGDSMYPTINARDSVKVQFHTNGISIDIGDIIVYHSWMVGVYVEYMWIGHRVTEKYKEGDTWYFKTKGDNCPEPDDWEVPGYAALGKIVSIEHAERVHEQRESTPQAESRQATSRNTLLSQEAETFLLIMIGACLSVAIAIFKNLRNKKRTKDF